MQRKGSFLLTGLLLFGYLAASANYENGQGSIGKDSLPPVETKPGFANYKPAHAGQTRIAGVKTTTAYKVEKIANKLGNPFAIVTMPDGRLMVTLKSGTMEIHDKNGALVKKITDLPKVVYEGQGGLLDVAFDPGYTTNKLIYWCYSEKVEGGSATAVAKGKLDEAGGRIDNITVIFRQTPATKGNLQFGS